VERAARGDARLAAFAALHGLVVAAFPTAAVLAIGLWWNSNTVAHQFIHRPYFRRRAWNQLFALYESALLGIPQAFWRDRHLAHHAGASARWRFTREHAVQSALVLSVWSTIAIRDPRFFIFGYVPGYLAGLLLCAIHGYYEHAGGTASHYSALYNVLLFNDGYHVEHHAYPLRHWTALPGCRVPDARASTWPAPLRWMDALGLQGLERLVLKSRILQRFVLRTHRRALGRLVRGLPDVQRIAIVGGGLFPRTALLLRELVPSAHITIVDEALGNLDVARSILNDGRIDFVHARYRGTDLGACDCDLLVIPLAFDGDRRAIYEHPPAPAVIVHDWLWRKRGESAVVSVALLKRMNVLRGPRT